MPGVPQEMKVVMTEEILPRLQNRNGSNSVIHKTFLIRNHAESVLAEKLTDWETALPESIKLAYLPKAGIIRLRLTARGDVLLMEELLAKEVSALKEILGNDIIAEDDVSIENLIGDKLRQKKMTLSTAESCTGGSVAARITAIAGCSDYFKGSVVAYSNEVKMSMLDVDAALLDMHGAVSEEVVIAMAKGVAKNLNTDCAVATSGIAGPGGGTPDKPVGTVWIAAVCGDEIKTYKQ